MAYGLKACSCHPLIFNRQKPDQVYIGIIDVPPFILFFYFLKIYLLAAAALQRAVGGTFIFYYLFFFSGVCDPRSEIISISISKDIFLRQNIIRVPTPKDFFL